MLVAATAQSDAFPSRRSGLAPSPTTPMVVFLAGFPDDTRQLRRRSRPALKAPPSSSWRCPATRARPSPRSGASRSRCSSTRCTTPSGPAAGDCISSLPMGSYLGLLYCDKHPTEVTKLALLDIGHQKMSDKQSLAEMRRGTDYQLFSPGASWWTRLASGPSPGSRTRCSPGRRSGHAIMNPCVTASARWREGE